MSKNKKKKSKEKVTYYDDNSTIVDMSQIPQRKGMSNVPRSTFREKWRTYINAVKMMIIPMCVVLVALSLIFLALLLLR